MCMANNGKALEKDVVETKEVTTVNKTTQYNYWANRYNKKVPFLPDGWEKDIDKYLAESKESKYKMKSFEKILRMTQVELKEHMKNVLKSNGYKKVVSEKGFLYAKGDVPILLVAHMDTVHKELPKDIIYKDAYMTSPQGIGGDDRCGIYIISQIIKDYKCHIVFTEDEEVGCVGAGLFAISKWARKLTGKLNFILEFDRRGTLDAVYYNCDNKDFEDFIADNSKFETRQGSCSDISEIAPELKTAAVNLSSGYYQEHTKAEYIDVEAMISTIGEATNLIKKSVETNEKFKYIEKTHKIYGGYYGWDDWGDGYSYRHNYDREHYGSGYSFEADDDDIYVSAKTIPAKQIYHIFFSINGHQYCKEYEAVSEEEAVGKFLMVNSDFCYDDIDYVFCGEVWGDDE